MPLRAADAHYRAQQRLQVAALSHVVREWRTMGSDFDSSWARVGPRLVALVAMAQAGAAKDGQQYVGDALDEQRIDVPPAFESTPTGFGGAYSIDGLATGSLDSLLYGAVVKARTAGTDTLSGRLSAGESFLSKAVPSQVADASRQAAGTQIFARPEIGYVRMVNPPCCQRCGVLAGAYFKHNAGFPRHPRCDCRHVPTYEARTDEVGYSIGPEDVKDLNATQRRAIADGADINQVINARRVYTTREGLLRPSYSADGMWTSEGTTRRGYASHVKREIARQRGNLAKETATNVGRRGFVKNSVERRVARPTPEAVYKYAESREEAIQLLAANGYIVAPARRLAALAT